MSYNVNSSDRPPQHIDTPHIDTPNIDTPQQPPEQRQQYNSAEPPPICDQVSIWNLGFSGSGGSSGYNKDFGSLPAPVVKRIVDNIENESDEVKNEYKIYKRNLFAFWTWRLEYSKKIFEHHIKASKRITNIVLTLFIFGIIATAVQLAYALFKGNISSLKTELAVEATKITISSSIVGAVIFILLVIFFFLYLKYIYKIQFPTAPEISPPPNIIPQKEQRGE